MLIFQYLNTLSRIKHFIIGSFFQRTFSTRMHSSRMRTVGTSSHVYPSIHWAGVCVYPNMHLAGAGMCVSQHALGRGGVCPGGGGVCPGGWCLPRGVVSARGGGRICSGVYSSMHWGKHPPPVNRMTDRCKNITLPQLRCVR